MKTQDTKFWPRIATIVGITLSFALAAPAEAGDTFRFQNKFANAFFSSTDPSGCIVTDVYVFAGENASVSHDPPGSPNSSTGSLAAIFISQLDVCKSIQVVAANCFADAFPDPDFQVIGGSLNSATLNTTLSCFDDVGSGSFDVSAALTWTGTGNPARESVSSHTRMPGFIFNSRFTSTSRFAEGLGSVSDGVTNFTPIPASSASIQNVKTGSVTVTNN